VILETYGSGNTMTDDWFLDLIRQTVENGIIVYNVTQCKAGSVEIGKYATSLELGAIGVLSGYDITIESAAVKLMYLFGLGLGNKEVVKLLQVSLRGEITVS